MLYQLSYSRVERESSARSGRRTVATERIFGPVSGARLVFQQIQEGIFRASRNR